ncbi:MAG: hypothetical protein C0522_11300 [Rhodocyclaceae bacterium]|nr:hypothetical protein [Rhodocyclaceae bacterium]
MSHFCSPIHSQAPLASIVAGRVTFNRAAIMRRVHDAGRFAFAACRSQAERRHQLSHWLRKVWREAKAEAVSLARHIEADAAVRRDLAARAAEAVALAGRYGNDADAIRQAIASESYRERMNFAAVDRLQAALATVRS